MKTLALLCATANLFAIAIFGCVLWAWASIAAWYSEAGISWLHPAAVVAALVLAAPAGWLLVAVITSRLRWAAWALALETALGLIVLGLLLSASSSSDEKVYGYVLAVELVAAAAVWFSWLDSSGGQRATPRSRSLS